MRVEEMGSFATEEVGAPPDVREVMERRVGTELRGCTWLSNRLLLLVFHVSRFRGMEPEIKVILEGAENPLLSHILRFALTGTEEKEGRVYLAIAPGHSESPRGRVALCVRSWRRRLCIEPEHLETRLCDVRTLLRTELADLPATTRSDIVTLTAGASQWHGEAGTGLELSETLHRIRNGLRDPLAPAVRDPSVPRGLSVDMLMAVDERAFWIKGWVHDADGPPAGLTAVSPEGMRADVLSGAYRQDRPDVRKMYDVPSSGREGPGFVNYFELDGPSLRREGWLCEMRGLGGGGVEADAPAVISDSTEVRNRILAELARSGSEAPFLARNHVHPALSRMQRRLAAEVGIDRVASYGRVPGEQDVSIVIPLYRRVDLVEHQLARFAHDPELAEADLVFVLDTPELAEALDSAATELSRLYGIPFRVVTLNRNAGIAAACNVGAGLARGRLLTFMHSDVIPGRSGWLGMLRDFHDANPGIGALGPKLLYEDGTVQSAGLHFRRDLPQGAWELASLLHGLHGQFPLATLSRPVPGVSGACLMVGREDFEAVDGFETAYVQGGYEDADLCLRLSRRGRESWYLAEGELFHLEGLSFPGKLKSLTGHYNRWLCNHTWSPLIEELEERYPVSGLAPAWPSADREENR